MDFFGWPLILLYAPSIKYCGTNAFSIKGCLFFKGYFRPLEYLAKNCILFTQDDVINMHHSGESQCYLKECKKPCKIQENYTLQSRGGVAGGAGGAAAPPGFWMCSKKIQTTEFGKQGIMVCKTTGFPSISVQS